jgi:hypothetical protein
VALSEMVACPRHISGAQSLKLFKFLVSLPSLATLIKQPQVCYVSESGSLSVTGRPYLKQPCVCRFVRAIHSIHTGTYAPLLRASTSTSSTSTSTKVVQYQYWNELVGTVLVRLDAMAIRKPEVYRIPEFFPNTGAGSEWPHVTFFKHFPVSLSHARGGVEGKRKSMISLSFKMLQLCLCIPNQVN